MDNDIRSWTGHKAETYLTYLSLRANLFFMEKPTVRTSLDIPVALHRRLHEAAGRQGCSARQLILRSIERAVDEIAPARQPRRLSLDPPIISSRGKPFDLTNEQIYDLIELP